MAWLVSVPECLLSSHSSCDNHSRLHATIVIVVGRLHTNCRLIAWGARVHMLALGSGADCC